MKIILTSSGLGFENETEITSFIGVDLTGLRVALVPTASSQDDIEMRDIYIKEDQKNIISLGMTYDMVNLETVNPNFIVDILEPYQIIYVCGGNTFYLMKEMNRSGFKDKIQEILKNKIYIGVSAGSVVAGMNIELAGWEPGDENNVGLNDMAGLKLVKYCIMPHAEEYDYQESSEYPYTVKYIKDGEIIMVDTDI